MTKYLETAIAIEALIKENKNHPHRYNNPQNHYNANGGWGYYIGFKGGKSPITGRPVWVLKAGKTGYWNMEERCNKQNLCLLASEDKPYYSEDTLVNTGKSLYGSYDGSEKRIRWGGYTEMFGDFETMEECEAAGWVLADIFGMKKEYYYA